MTNCRSSTHEESALVAKTASALSSAAPGGLTAEELSREAVVSQLFQHFIPNLPVTAAVVACECIWVHCLSDNKVTHAGYTHFVL